MASSEVYEEEFAHYRRRIPLDQARFEIRLLEIEPQTSVESNTSTLTCRLICVSLIDPPDYVALFYCWGAGLAYHGISINGEDVAVTVNLLAALQEGRQRGVRLVWADAICINQADMYEKAAQIQLMGRIYARATSCVAWLGTSDVSSNSALAVLNAAKSLEANSGSPWRVKSDSARVDFYNSVNAILDRPYWRRKWILQEVAKAKSVQLWCGPDQVDLEHVLDVLLRSGRNAGGPRLTSKSRDLLQSLRLLRMQEQKALYGAPRKRLAWALVYTRRSRVTDARDAIYSLLGLTSDGLDMVPTPNYVESAADVFAMTLKTIIKHQNQMALLLLARRNDVVSDAASTRAPLELPSWVPNFAKLPRVLPPWIVQALERADMANMGATITPNFTTGSPLRSLTILGAVLGRVTHVEGMPSSQAERPTKLGKSHRSKDPYFHSGDAYGILARLFRTIVSLTTLHPDAILSSKHASVFAQLTPPPTSVTGLAVPWFESVKSMKVSGKTIERWVARHEAKSQRSLENERRSEQSLAKRSWLQRVIIPSSLSLTSAAQARDEADSKRRRTHEKQELSRVRAELEKGLQAMANGNMRLVVTSVVPLNSTGKGPVLEPGILHFDGNSGGTSDEGFMLAYTNVRPGDIVSIFTSEKFSDAASIHRLLRSQTDSTSAFTPTMSNALL
ncbi:hypothetical protein LTR10_006371 [Elasticomyces elasticus]|nr:hypothetical protein LTR10_006371 [Elasticomyces elasticus]